jgi:hypothetical protein
MVIARSIGIDAYLSRSNDAIWASCAGPGNRSASRNSVKISTPSGFSTSKVL